LLYTAITGSDNNWATDCSNVHQCLNELLSIIEE
jgi:hypothetical protein